MRRRRSLDTVGFLLALSAVSGCTCGEEAKKKSQPAAETPPTEEKEKPTVGPEGMRKRGEALRRLRLAPMTLEDVTPLIPTIPGATAIGQPGLLTEGRQVKAVLCLTSPSAEVATSQLTGALGSLGFTGVKTRPHPQMQERLTLHADKHPYQVGATIQKGSTPDCPGDKGKVKVVLSYFKRVATVPEATETPPTP